MPWPVLEFDGVRALIDLGLTESALGDDVLEQDVFLLRAQDDALAVDPGAASYPVPVVGSPLATDAKYLRVKRALEYFVAARVASSFRQKQSETWQGGRYAYRRPDWDGETRGAQLAAEGAAILAGNLTVTETPRRMPTAFSRVPGGRWP